MTTTAMLLYSIVLGLFLAMLGLQVLGYRLGRRRTMAPTDESREGAGVVEGAVFALLGLMLAFQFGGAASRLSDRRDIVVEEANAIGTAYLRLDLLEASDAAPIRALFKQYVDAHIRGIEVMPDVAAADDQYAIAEALQVRIWTAAVESLARRPDRETELLLLPALNEMIDSLTSRKALGRTHAAVSVQVFLIALALIGAALAGHAMSRTATMPVLHMVLFSLVISATIYFILDMEFPRFGSIRIGASDQPMYDLQSVMQQH